MRDFLIVGLGGFLGSGMRWFLESTFHKIFLNFSFPGGILIVNLVGCLGIGLCAGFIESRELVNPSIRLFLIVGILGGFTTFSSFANDSFALLRSGSLGMSLANIGLNVGLGMSAVYLGLTLSEQFR